MTAMSVLPLEAGTLKYGRYFQLEFNLKKCSDDAGRTVHADIPELNRMFEAAAGVLNLKGSTLQLESST